MESLLGTRNVSENNVGRVSDIGTGISSPRALQSAADHAERSQRLAEIPEFSLPMTAPAEDVDQTLSTLKFGHQDSQIADCHSESFQAPRKFLSPSTMCSRPLATSPSDPPVDENSVREEEQIVISPQKVNSFFPAHGWELTLSLGQLGTYG